MALQLFGVYFTGLFLDDGERFEVLVCSEVLLNTACLVVQVDLNGFLALLYKRLDLVLPMLVCFDDPLGLGALPKLLVDLVGILEGRKFGGVNQVGG